MKSVPPLPRDAEPVLLLDWDHLDRRRWREAAWGSLLFHAALVALLLWAPIPSAAPPVAEQNVARRQTQITPLVAPPMPLTQREPNRSQVPKEIDLAGLLPQSPSKTPARAALPSAPAPAAPKQAPAAAPAVPEPPRIEVPAELPQRTAQLQVPAAPPPPAPAAAKPQLPVPAAEKPAERPKIAFESPGSFQSGTPGGAIAVPKASVDEAVRSAARNQASGGTTVGDIEDFSPAAPANPFGGPPTPGRNGSRLELLSDPQGVDFKPYLIRVLAAVRRNWFAVMPESARFGRRGKVQIQFSIDREGRVPKLVISLPSGAEALDRAAVAGISASNPFPPLPSEFKGDHVRLQLSFLYNLKQ